MQWRRWPKCILLQYLLDIHTTTLHSERSRGRWTERPVLGCIMQGCQLHIMEDGSVVIRIISYEIVILHFRCLPFKMKAPETLSTEEDVTLVVRRRWLPLCWLHLLDTSCIKTDLCILMYCQSIVMFTNASATSCHWADY